MARPKEKLQTMLREQMGLLRSSLHSFYEGTFAESVRIATILRVLVHETGKSKPLPLDQVQHSDYARPAGVRRLIPSIYSEASRRENVKENLGTSTQFGKSRLLGGRSFANILPVGWFGNVCEAWGWDRRKVYNEERMHSSLAYRTPSVRGNRRNKVRQRSGSQWSRGVIETDGLDWGNSVNDSKSLFCYPP
jgi:hypothetical protein